MFFSKSTQIKSLVTIAAFALITGSCKVKSSVLSSAVTLQIPGQFPAANDSNASVVGKHIFTDPHLVQLIELALRQNPDVFIATQRIEQAAAQFRIRRAAILPAISAEVSASAQKYGDYTMEGVGNYDTNLSGNIDEDQKVPLPLVPNYFLGLRSSWEIDLWGKLRNRKKAAYMSLLASQEGRSLVMTTLIAEVATRYYELVSLDAIKNVIRDNIALQDSAVMITIVQKDAGRTTELGVQQMRAQLMRTKALLARTEQDIFRVENELNFYLGRFPQSVIRHSDLSRLNVTAVLNAIQPAEVLQRRPDIVQAGWRLKAMGADVQAAQAALLPSLTLSPFAGYSSFNRKLLFDPASLAYGIVGGITAPLINRSALKGDLKQKKAELIEAHYSYNKTVLEAFREIYTTLNDMNKLKEAYQYNKEETETLDNAVVTANELFKAGYASYLEVVTAQRSVIEAQVNLIETQKNILQAQVLLYRSVGGNW